jgi:hypothetical protein
MNKGDIVVKEGIRYRVVFYVPSINTESKRGEKNLPAQYGLQLLSPEFYSYTASMV